jgi:RHS repeat-associated protein
MRTREALLCLALCALAACHRAPSSFEVPQVLRLAECDPASYVPCIRQRSFLSIPIVNSGLNLTYSSEWRFGPNGSPLWDNSNLGLGGWSLDPLQQYDRANHVLISGDGSWRITDAVPLPSGESAVPSYDGLLAYIFDAAGRHVRTLDGRFGSELITVKYDPSGRLLSIAGYVGGYRVGISVERDAEGRAHRLTGIDGSATTLTLNDEGSLTRVEDPTGSVTRIGWYAAGLVSSKIDAHGNSVTFTYDQSGHLAVATDEDQVAMRYERKTLTNGLELTTTTPLGRRYSYRVESASDGLRRTFLPPDGTTSSETLDPGGLRKIHRADGTTISIGQHPHPTWGTSAPLLTPVTEVRPDGKQSVLDLTYDLKPHDSLPYVLEGSITMMVNREKWIEKLDPASRTVESIEPTGRQSRFTYDSNGRLLSSSIPGSADVRFSYDNDGQVVSITTGSGATAQVTQFSYDSSNGVITARLPDNSTRALKVDASGRLSGVVNGDGSTTLASFNRLGRLFEFQTPGGMSYAIGTSPAGRFTSLAMPIAGDDASVQTLAYDADGKPEILDGPGPQQAKMEYDSAGRLASLSFDRGRRTVAYDPRSGLVAQFSDPSGVTTRYDYVGPRRTGISWAGAIVGAVSESLDENGNVARETVNGAAELQYDYDASGLLRGLGPLTFARDEHSMVTRAVLGNLETHNEFNENRQLVHTVTAAGGNVLFDARYERDALGRLKSVTETSAGKKSILEYEYDRAGRLSDVRLDAHYLEHYEYDIAGNRTTSVTSSEKRSASYDARDRIVSSGNDRFEWSSDGHLRRRVGPSGVMRFEYDDFGGLREVRVGDKPQVSYLLDAEGRRVGRRIGGQLTAQYLYRSDGTLAAELDGAGKLVSRFWFDDQGSLALIERAGSIFRVITDSRGSPRLIIDSKTGTVADAISYDTWGRIVQESSPGFLPIGFAGGLRDVDTGLVRFGARDYDPSIGRWTAADPLLIRGGDSNLYAYVAGDPVNLVDRSGLFVPIGPILPVLGLGAIGVFQFVGTLNLMAGTIEYLIPKKNGPSQGNPANNNPVNTPTGNNPGNGLWGTQNPNPPQDPRNWECDSEFCLPPGTQYGCVGTPEAPARCGMRNGVFYCHASTCTTPGGPLCGDSDFCNWGDPHLVDGRSRHFDFQAAGEFLVLASPDGKLVVQSRQERLGGSSVAANTALAMNVAGDKVELYLREPSFLWVNGNSLETAEVEEALPHGGRLLRHGGLVNVRWPDGDEIQVQAYSGMLNYGFKPGPHTTALRGLLGSDTDLLFGANTSGVTLKMDEGSYDKLYKEFAARIRIQPSESLFHYGPDEGTAKFTDVNFPPALATTGNLPADARAEAERICRAFGIQSQPLLDNCILDVATTGKPAVAAVSLLSLGDVQSPDNASDLSRAQAQEFAISIGDTVSPGHPAGGGSIGASGGKQTYSFQATAGTLINVSSTSCDGQPYFDVQDPAGNSLGGRNGCGVLPTLTLPVAGTFRIVVSSDHAARYGFTLHQTRVDQFTLHVGDAVAPDSPTTGAGILSVSGQRQSYAVAVKAGDRVYVKVGPCEGNPILELKDPANSVVDGHVGCGDFGPDILKAEGTYHLDVRSDDAGITKYSFALLPARIDTYRIQIGDTVSPDRPAPGAGIITEPGQRQAFEFVGRGSDVVYVFLSPCEGAFPAFDLLKEDGSSIAGHLGRCDEELGRVVLPETGTYRIVARTDPPNYRSRYGFSITRPPADQHFRVQLPFTVSNGAPVAGAGVLTAAGAQQFFDFSAKPGVQVHVETHCDCPKLTLRAVKAGDTSNDSYAQFNGLKPDWKLPDGGQYTLQVLSHGYAGPYSLTATQLAEH